MYDTIPTQVLHAFFLLIIIMGSLTGLPVFLKITEKFDVQRRVRSGNKAIMFSLCFFVFFLLFGNSLLMLFGISFESFKIAGGIILLLMGIVYMFHINIHEQRSARYATDVIVPFAMPLIIGPGVIATIILLVNWYGYIITFIGGAFALFLYWLVLFFAVRIANIIGEQGIEVIARIMGLLLMAIAIEMMTSGVMGFIKIGLSG